MKTKNLFTVILLMFAVGFASCGQKNTDIVGIRWKLIEWNSEDVSEKGVWFILHTKPNEVSGYGGCNWFQGKYKIKSGNRFNFSRGIQTLKHCDADIFQICPVSILVIADNYTIKDDTLLVYQAGVRLAHFVVVQ